MKVRRVLDSSYGYGFSYTSEQSLQLHLMSLEDEADDNYGYVNEEDDDEHDNVVRSFSSLAA